VSERLALLLVFVAALMLTAVLVLGLTALGANGSMAALGALAALAFGADGVARVTMHYGSSHRDHRD
jgi:hypothetical protein